MSYKLTKKHSAPSSIWDEVTVLSNVGIEGHPEVKPDKFNKCNKEMYFNVNIDNDICNPDNIGDPCKISVKSTRDDGICTASPTSTGIDKDPTVCVNACVPYDVPDVHTAMNVPPGLYNIQSYWDKYKEELMNLEYIPTTHPSDIWVIAPSPSEIDVVCSDTCIDTDYFCKNMDLNNMDEFCNSDNPDPNQDPNKCCLCNSSKWSHRPYFVGETESTGYSYTTNFGMNNTIKSSGQNSDAERLHNIFNVPSPTELVFKKAKTGYLKPYDVKNNISENNCYFPLPSKKMSSSSVPTNKYYEYKEDIKKDYYVFGKPIIRTFVNTENKGRSIDISDSYSDIIPKEYFYMSNPTSILEKTGYHEQCFYGTKDSNEICPTTCPKDMINAKKSINSINTYCTRCEPGTGEIYKGANECSPCYAINKLNSDSKPYGCTDCPDNEIFVKSTKKCTSCPTTDDHILTICENTENHICPNPTYEINLMGNNKKEFYNNCYSNHPSCQVTEHCIFKDHTKNVTATNLPESVTPTHNLYMNEVCKTITNSNSCDLVEECKWFDEKEKCFIKLPSPSPNKILIPMNIPSNISDEATLRELNAFTTPSPSDGISMQCSVTNSDDEYHEYDILNFWNGLPTPTIPESETSCKSDGIPSIRINNKYTNSELNVYAHPYKNSIDGSHISPCEYHGCVNKDKYYEASIPEFIGPLCQELSDIYTYYDNVNVIKPNSLSDLVNNPTQYGCLLTKT